MHPLLTKLQFKEASPALLLNEPETFRETAAALAEVTDLHRLPTATTYPFILGFCEDEAQLRALVPLIQDKLTETTLLWVAYPKKSSKRYRSDLNRDVPAWQLLGELGFEGVRQVAIDMDWSALRFRHVSQIKSMTRDPKWALSDEGRRRSET